MAPKGVPFRKITFMRDEGPGADLDGNLETLPPTNTAVCGAASALARRRISGRLLLGEWLPGSETPPRLGIGLAGGRDVEHDGLVRMRTKFQPRVPPSRQGFDGKRDVAAAGLPGDAMPSADRSSSLT